MPAPNRLPPPPYRTARDRIAARRAAQRARSPRAIGTMLALVALLVAVVLVLVLRRAEQTLEAIQQQDPRRAPAAATVRAAQGDRNDLAATRFQCGGHGFV